MATTEHVWHLRRHLLAREPFFVGEEVAVPGTVDTAFVGNGIHPDGEAHLAATEYEKAVKIGETLSVPQDFFSVLSGGIVPVLIAPSPLARARETATYLFVGMAKAYAQNVHDISVLSPETQRVLAFQGLHKIAEVVLFEALNETKYKNSRGKPDEGNELVAEAYHKIINPSFPCYQWMVQKGFELDQRSEPPLKVMERGFRVMREVLTRSVILSTTHQPNLEIITAGLTGDLGTNARELWERAGGGYELGGGFELRVLTNASGKISDAQLRRTLKDLTKLEMVLNVDMDALRRYMVQ